MTPEEKKEILQKSKEWFREVGVAHKKNTEKLTSIKKFAYNPFLISYLSYFHSGDCSPESLAKALIYPRVLQTSLTTSFGNAIQKFTHSVLDGFGSGVSGMDIEFIDFRDNRRKYCQLKAGPNTLNAKDVQPINNEFKSAYKLCKTNGLRVEPEDFILGVIYGEINEISANYKAVQKEYPVVVGKDFWYALTGDNDFYYDLIDACAEVAYDVNGTELLKSTIEKLANTKEIRQLSAKLSERKEGNSK